MCKCDLTVEQISNIRRQLMALSAAERYVFVNILGGYYDNYMNEGTALRSVAEKDIKDVEAWTTK